jgi:hypothetical protein
VHEDVQLTHIRKAVHSYGRKIVYCNLKATRSYEFRKIKPSNKLEKLTNEGKRKLQ